MNFHLRPYNQYILNIVTNIYLGLDFYQIKNNKIEYLIVKNEINPIIDMDF